MHERLRKKIDFITEITCWDNHKSRDMDYSIEAYYRPYSDTPLYQPNHSGYLWDLDEYDFCNEEFTSYNAAEDALELAIDQQVASEFEWFGNFLKNPDQYDRFGSPINAQEELDSYKERYKEIK